MADLVIFLTKQAKNHQQMVVKQLQPQLQLLQPVSNLTNSTTPTIIPPQHAVNRYVDQTTFSTDSRHNISLPIVHMTTMVDNQHPSCPPCSQTQVKTV